jgi:RHS repeat-associated protein
VGILNTQSDNFMLPLQRSGNRKTRTDKRLGTTLTYAYDNIYQLLTAKQGTTTKESYTGACPERYSSREAMRVSRRNPVGNRLSSVGVSPYSYNSSNQLTSIPGTTYTYDNNGNTKTKTTSAGTTTYTWDYDNRLTQVALPGTAGTVTFKYDPFGRRVQKSFTQGGTTITTNYLYDGPNLLEEVDSSGNVLARYSQPRLDEPLSELRSGTASYYQQDGLGSSTSLSNSAGAIANTYTYDSFGKLTASTGTLTNPFQYTGREFDSETGLYFYRARYFDPPTGRFLSEDPIGFSGGLNFYAYVQNSPLNFLDPSGLHSVYYDGQYVRVFDDLGRLLLRCRAYSGRPGTSPADQSKPWEGPLPRGNYYFDPSEWSPGNFVRDMLGDWGTWRVRLYPYPGTDTFGRDNFFLHGGKTPGSAGCIDAQNCIDDIHRLLKNHDGVVPVTVRYTNFAPF